MNTHRTDEELARDVRAELAWEPVLRGATIGVDVKNGVVTLTGRVSSYDRKQTAERAAQRIAGVRAVAEELEVDLTVRTKTDPEIASAAVDALRWNTSIPEERLRVVVENGIVRLDGTVDWWYQRQTAEDVVRPLTGVRGLVNRILIQPAVKPADVRTAIQHAFERHARIDASRIQVQATSGKVTLSGTVHDWTERAEAERAAWSAPGVTAVEDKLVVV